MGYSMPPTISRNRKFDKGWKACLMREQTPSKESNLETRATNQLIPGCRADSRMNVRQDHRAARKELPSVFDGFPLRRVRTWFYLTLIVRFCRGSRRAYRTNNPS